MGLAVLACLFDIVRDSRRAANFDLFRAGLARQGVALHLVEAASDGQPFFLAASDCLVQLRASARLWHKERLLNIGIRHLPAAVDAVVLADADLLFENDDWARQTEALLARHPVVQPMQATVRLGPDEHRPTHDAGAVLAFAAMSPHGALCIAGGTQSHGHPGFAWAMRRSLLDEVGLFDLCLSGSGDHLMAHGILGDTASPCIQRHLLGAPAYAAAFGAWAQAMRQRTGGRLAAAPGRALHLYHGPGAGGVYVRRSLSLAQAGFDPARDLRATEGELHAPTRASAAFVAWHRDHFGAIQEK